MLWNIYIFFLLFIYFFFFFKFVRNNVGKYGTADALSVLDNQGYRHTYRHLLFYHGNNGYANPLRFYFICTLPVLFTCIYTVTYVGDHG